VKLIFLNVWGEEMQPNLVDYIKEQTADTDIFCFQEASDVVKDAARDALSGYKEISDYKYITDHDNFPQSIFVRDGIEVVSSGTLFQGEMDRGLAIYVEIKLGDKNIYVCNVHGSARPNDKTDSPARIEVSKALIEFFADKNEAPVIIGGDFNINPDTKSIGMFSENGYRDLIHEFSIKTTRNHFAWDRFPDTPLYYSDYIFLNDKVELKNFSVTDNEVSDHLPLVLEVEI